MQPQTPCVMHQVHQYIHSSEIIFSLGEFLVMYSCQVETKLKVMIKVIRRWLKLAYFFMCASLVVQLVKNPPATQETLVGFLNQEDPLEKE